MARNLELEQEIRSAPNGRSGYLVYADWLQSRGDPRGELIVVQIALEEETDPQRRQTLLLEQEDLFTLWEPELLGNLPSVGPMVWKNGFVSRMTLLPAASLEDVEEALQHPSTALLQSVDISLRPRDEDALRTAFRSRGIQLTPEAAVPEDPIFEGIMEVEEQDDFFAIRVVFQPEQPSWLHHIPGYEFLLGTRVGNGVHVFGCDDRTGPSSLSNGPIRSELFTIPRPETEQEVAFALLLSLFHHEHRETTLRFTGGGLMPPAPGNYPVQLRKTQYIDDPALRESPRFEPQVRRGRAKRRPPTPPPWFDANAPVEAQFVERHGRWMIWTTWQLSQGRRILELSAIDLSCKRVAHRWTLPTEGILERATLHCNAEHAWVLVGGFVHGFNLLTGARDAPWTLPTPRLRYRHRGFHAVGFHPRPRRAAWMLELRDGLRNESPCLIGWVDHTGSRGQVLVPDNSPTGAHAHRPTHPTVAVTGDGQVLALGHRWLWLVDPESGTAAQLAESWDFDEVRVTRHQSGNRVWNRGPDPTFVEFSHRD